MIATGVIHLIAHERGEELGEGNRTPHHHECQTEEPLPEVHFVGTHQPQAHQDDEYRDEECGQSEVNSDEGISQNSSDGTAIICKLAVGIEPFAWSQVFQDALVGLPRLEIGHHSNRQEDCHTDKDDS